MQRILRELREGIDVPARIKFLEARNLVSSKCPGIKVYTSSPSPTPAKQIIQSQYESHAHSLRVARVLSRKFLLGGGGAHSEREYFAKSARREVIDPCISYENALLSFGSSINLTAREKVSVHCGD